MRYFWRDAKLKSMLFLCLKTACNEQNGSQDVLLTLSLPWAEFSGSPCFHCYLVGGAIVHFLKKYRISIKTQEKKKQKQVFVYVSRCICKIGLGL